MEYPIPYSEKNDLFVLGGKVRAPSKVSFSLFPFEYCVFILCSS